MLLKYLVLGPEPEIRSDQGRTEFPEIELLIPVDKFWELQEIVRQIRYTRSSDLSAQRYWVQLSTVIKPYVKKERDRLWLAKNMRGN